jgi:hypothetical protein
MIIPRFIAALGFALGGWVAGSAMREILQIKSMQVTAVFLLMISFAFPIYTIREASKWIPIYAHRAQAWDAREAIIQNALDTGEPLVIIHPIDGADVGGIRDLDPYGKKGFWINLCAREYYGIILDSVEP